MTDVTAIIHHAIHMESARIAPQTSELIEAAKLGLAEINKLRNVISGIENAAYEALKPVSPVKRMVDEAQRLGLP